MSPLALSFDTPACYAPAVDVSLSTDASIVREALAAALPPRYEEIAQRLESAIVVGIEEGHQLRSLRTIATAIGLLVALPLDIPLPAVVVESPAEIGFDWDEDPSRVLSVTVDESRRISYASILAGDSSFGRLEFAQSAGRVPETLLHLLHRIYSLHS